MTKHMDVVMESGGSAPQPSGPAVGCRQPVARKGPDTEGVTYDRHRPTLLQNTRQFGWDAVYGAMFVPPLVECGVAVGSGLHCVSAQKQRLRRSVDLTDQADRCREETSDALTGKTAVSPGSTALPNPTDSSQPDVQANAGGRHAARAGKACPSSSISDFLNWMIQEQAR